MKGPCYHFHLVSFAKAGKVYRIAGHTDGKLWVFFRMFVGIHQHFPVQYVYVQVVGILTKIAIEQIYQVLNLNLAIAAKRFWNHAHGI